MSKVSCLGDRGKSGDGGCGARCHPERSAQRAVEGSASMPRCAGVSDAEARRILPAEARRTAFRVEISAPVQRSSQSTTPKNSLMVRGRISAPRSAPPRAAVVVACHGAPLRASASKIRRAEAYLQIPRLASLARDDSGCRTEDGCDLQRWRRSVQSVILR